MLCKKWRTLTIFNGKHVDFDRIVVKGYDIKKLIDALGWTNFYVIDETQYLKVMHSFYAIVQTSMHDNLLSQQYKESTPLLPHKNFKNP